MKKIYLLLLIMTISLNLFCQQEDKMVLDSIQGYTGGKGTDTWVNQSFVVYKYDKAGNLTEQIDHYWDSETEGWKGSYYEVNECTDAILDLALQFECGPCTAAQGTRKYRSLLVELECQVSIA